MRTMLLMFCMVTLVASCQTAGKTVSTQTSKTCPKCKLETKTMAIKGLTYNTDMCPECKTVWEPRGGSNYDEDAMVHVCDHCKMMTEKCPVCAAQMRP